MNQVYVQESPCLHCIRVKDPENCENKLCKPWRMWWMHRWDQIRAFPRQQIDVMAPRPVGVCLGGRHYAAPHQIAAYLKEDPCDRCLCPRELCHVPCRIRMVWEATKSEVRK